MQRFTTYSQFVSKIKFTICVDQNVDIMQLTTKGSIYNRKLRQNCAFTFGRIFQNDVYCHFHSVPVTQSLRKYIFGLYCSLQVIHCLSLSTTINNYKNTASNKEFTFRGICYEINRKAVTAHVICHVSVAIDKRRRRP